MRRFQQWLCFALVCPLILSCTKSKEVLQPTPDPQTYEEILTAKHWKITSMKAVPAYRDPQTGAYLSDLMSAWMEHCEMDDALVFRMDGTRASETGEEKCNQQAAIEELGQWKLIFGHTKLQFIDLKGQSIVYDIDQITSQQIRLRSSNILNKLSTAKLVLEPSE